MERIPKVVTEDQGNGRRLLFEGPSFEVVELVTSFPELPFLLQGTRIPLTYRPSERGSQGSLGIERREGGVGVCLSTLTRPFRLIRRDLSGSETWFLR